MAVEMKTCGAMGLSGTGLAFGLLTSLTGGLASVAYAPSAQADVVAYWNFDDPSMYDGDRLLSVQGGRNGEWGPDALGNYGGAIRDVSGNGNHLTAWTEAEFGGYYKRVDNPGNVANGEGGERTNLYSVTNARGHPSMYTHSRGANPSGIDVERANYTNFTIEASYKAEDFWGTRTIVGRDGANVALVGDVHNPVMAPLSMQVDAFDRIVFFYIDKVNQTHQVATEPGFVKDYALGTPESEIASDFPWYNIAAVNDGETLKLFVNGQLMDTADLSGSLDTDIELSTAILDDPMSRNNAWTVGRGMQSGHQMERAFGLIDEVRISNHAMAYEDLLQNRMPEVMVPEPAGLLAAGLASVGLLARRRRMA